MPVLRLDHPEPWSATLGVMLYPGTDEASQRLARAFAAQWLSAVIRHYDVPIADVPSEVIATIVRDAGAPLDDVSERWWKATATGEQLKLFYAHAQTDPSRASWKKACQLASIAARRESLPGSPSLLSKARSEYQLVAHLWAAWQVRAAWRPDAPLVAYDGGGNDFLFFLAEAETFRRWGQTWRPHMTPLPAEVWQPPDDWVPPEVPPGRPPAGTLPRMHVPEDRLRELPQRKPGRPRKSS